MKGVWLQGRDTPGRGGGGGILPELAAVSAWSENCDWTSRTGEMQILGLADDAVEELWRAGEDLHPRTISTLQHMYVHTYVRMYVHRHALFKLHTRTH